MMDKACNTNVEKRNAYKISVGKPDGKRPLGTPRLQWVDNIKMSFSEMVWGGMDWILLGVGTSGGIL
jgi:hypothetical protein